LSSRIGKGGNQGSKTAHVLQGGLEVLAGGRPMQLQCSSFYTRPSSRIANLHVCAISFSIGNGHSEMVLQGPHFKPRWKHGPLVAAFRLCKNKYHWPQERGTQIEHQVYISSPYLVLGTARTGSRWIAQVLLDSKSLTVNIMAYVEDSTVKSKYEESNGTVQVVSEVEPGVAEKITRSSSVLMVIVAGAALFSDGCTYVPTPMMLICWSRAPDNAQIIGEIVQVEGV
jgi:hypothetical protein